MAVARSGPVDSRYDREWPAVRHPRDIPRKAARRTMFVKNVR